MVSSLAVHGRDELRVKRLVSAQVVVMLLVSAISWMVFGASIGRDALLGGVAATLGSLLFAVWVFRRYSAAQPQQMLQRFYAGELIKIASVVVVFAVAMASLEDLNPIALFGAFFVVQVLPSLLANRIAS